MKTAIKKNVANGIDNKTTVLSIAKNENQNVSAPDAKQDKPEATAEPKEVVSIDQQVKDILHAPRPSAEDRIKNAKNFEILTTRFEFLKNKAEELNRFNLHNAGTNTKLILKNQSGADFEVLNSGVIDEVLNVMGEKLKKLLTDTEAEVLNFQI